VTKESLEKALGVPIIAYCPARDGGLYIDFSPNGIDIKKGVNP
jgi:hypothetical protein